MSILSKEVLDDRSSDRHIRQHKGETPYACTFPGCHLKAENRATAARDELLHEQEVVSGPGVKSVDFGFQ